MAFRKQHRNPGSGKCISEGLASLEREFQLRQREARVDGDKSPFRIGGHQGGVLRSTVLSHPVTKGVKQGPRLVTIRDVETPVWTSKSRQFLRLMDVTAQQNQELGWPASVPRALVALREHVVRQQRKNFVRRDLLADAGHSHERTQRARNNDTGGFGGLCIRLLGTRRSGCAPTLSREKGGQTHRQKNQKKGGQTARRFHGWSPSSNLACFRVGHDKPSFAVIQGLFAHSALELLQARKWEDVGRSSPSPVAPNGINLTPGVGFRRVSKCTRASNLVLPL